MLNIISKKTLQQRAEALARTRERDAEIERLYNDGAPYRVIGAMVGLSTSGIFARCRKLGLPLRAWRWQASGQGYAAGALPVVRNTGR